MPSLYNKAGILVPPAIRGFMLGTRTVLVATGDFIPNRYAKLIYFQIVGGGGGGKNAANSSAGQIVLGGGGGGGGYAEMLYPAVPQGFTFTLGTGGSGASGGAGGTSSIVLKVGVAFPAGTGTTTILQAIGGAAGATIATGTSQIFSSPGNVSFGVSVTSLVVATRLGGIAYRDSGTVAKSGKGGNSTLGMGGRSIIAHGVGTNGGSYGGGGSGGMSVNAAGATNGGNGADGVCIIWEYY